MGVRWLTTNLPTRTFIGFASLCGESPMLVLRGHALKKRDASPRTPNLKTPTAFLARARFEKNVHHDVLAGAEIKSELADHYFWVAFRGGNVDTSRKDFPIEVPLGCPAACD